MQLKPCKRCEGKGFLTPGDTCPPCRGTGVEGDDPMCRCGHPASEHHLVWYRGFITCADECEVYGFNETGGMQYVDGKWVDHCQGFEYADV